MEEKTPHSLNLSQRKQLTVTGVEEIAGFDAAAVVLHTAMGVLVIEGENLRLKKLLPEGGRVEVEGNICALGYREERKGTGWLHRLLE